MDSHDVLEIHAIATKAIVDREFESAILKNRRWERLEEFSLSEGMTEKVVQIRASSLQDFIAHLDRLADLARSGYGGHK